MKIKILIFLPLICFLSSCGRHNTGNNDGPEIIDIKKAFEKPLQVKISDIAKDFKYIALESNDYNLIGSNYIVYAVNQYLISIDRSNIFLFSRENGKFIRTIGKPGKGPDEYSRPYTKMPFDEEKRTVHAEKNKERFEYDLQGNLKAIKEGPDQVYDFININDSTYASFIDNYMGDERNKIIIFDNNDSVIKIYPNYQSFPFKGSVTVYRTNSWFYRLNRQTYFCEKFNDTLFLLTSESLIPKFVFSKGIYTFPYELRGSINDMENKYFLTENILESSKYLFYTFRLTDQIYTALYDKEKKTVRVNDYIGKSGKGYINNVNDFVPLELSSINEKGELVCTIDAFRIKQWFEDNPEKTEKLPEYMSLLKEITESENPVVMISSLNE